jgi:hypothetical protein
MVEPVGLGDKVATFNILGTVVVFGYTLGS